MVGWGIAAAVVTLIAGFTAIAIQARRTVARLRPLDCIADLGAEHVICECGDCRWARDRGVVAMGEG